MLSPAVALLADGRFPTGGHAHSGGFEAAHREFGLSTVAEVGEAIEARLATVGTTEAALLAAIRHQMNAGSVDWHIVDAELTARIAPPALRDISRSLGRQWHRAGREVFGEEAIPDVDVTGTGCHQLTAIAVVMRAAAVSPGDAVVVHLHHLVATVTTAAVRLLGADPWAMQRLHHGLGSRFVTIAEEALAGAARPWCELPAWSAPWADQLAQEHASWDVRLFRS